jgi:hypothetical protein
MEIAVPLPISSVSSYVDSIAKQHGVSYLRTPSDELADVVTRLSGDEVTTDATEDLIVALRRANVIDGPTMISLLGSHLDERLCV